MSDQQEAGDRIADELAAIRELLTQIAGALFEIAAGDEQDEDQEPSRYADGSIRPS